MIQGLRSWKQIPETRNEEPGGVLPKGLLVPERALKQRNEQVQDGKLGISNRSNADSFAPVAPLQGAGYRLTARSQGFADGKPSDSTLGCTCLSPPGM